MHLFDKIFMEILNEMLIVKFIADWAVLSILTPGQNTIAMKEMTDITGQSCDKLVVLSKIIHTDVALFIPSKTTTC